MKRRSVWAVVLLVLTLTQCWRDAEPIPAPPWAILGIVGRVTHKDGRTPVSGAEVRAVSDNGSSFAATSKNNGAFRWMDVPDGLYTLTATKGSFDGAELTIEVRDGRSVRELVLPLGIHASMIGVVPGSWDNIGGILSDLGYQYTTLRDADLAVRSKLEPIKMLFLNCGSDVTHASNPDVIANLQRFVDEGGYLYASDYDYDYIEAAWPSAISFYDPAKIGEIQEITTYIDDSDMAAYLGEETAEVVFDLGAWVVMDTVASGTDVLVSGSFSTSEGMLNDRPLMVAFRRGEGVAVFTSFHNESQLTRDVRTILVYFISIE